VVNYLSRLGWSHGDAELFSVGQLVEWFDLGHISRSPAQFNPEKLRWVNQHYMKEAGNERLAAAARERITGAGGKIEDGPPLEQVVALLKDRSETTEALAEDAMMFYREVHPTPELLAAHVTPEIRTVLADLATQLESLPEWGRDAVNGAVQATLKQHGVKMPKLAVPVRVCVFGRTQTPDFATVLTLAGRQQVVARIRHHLAAA